MGVTVFENHSKSLISKWKSTLFEFSRPKSIDVIFVDFCQFFKYLIFAPKSFFSDFHTCVVVDFKSFRNIYEVFVLATSVTQFGFQILISTSSDSMLRSTDVIQNGHYTRFGLLFFNQLTNNGVIKVGDLLPSNAFLNIFFLK